MKKIITFLLALCFAMGLMSAGVLASEHNHCVCGANHAAIGDHETEEAIVWQPVVDMNENGVINGDDMAMLESGNYYLTADVILECKLSITEQGWRVKKNTNINLCLNGFALIAPQVSYNSISLIHMGENSTLTITDCHSGEAVGKITGADSRGAVYVPLNSKFMLFNGNITGNRDGVTTDCGDFIMYGGAIAGNTLGDSSLSYIVDIYDGDFIMYGGEISKNTVYLRNIYINEGTFTMYGGKIVANEGKDDSMDGHIVMSGSTINLFGGEISGNTTASNSDSYGAAIYLQGGNLNVKGNPVVKNNKSLRGESNIYVSYGKKINVLEGGLTEGASLGVTMGDSVGSRGLEVTSEADADYSPYFFSDKEKYSIINKENGGKHTVMIMEEKGYVVYFQGAVVEAQNVKHGEKAQKPADPTQTGFTFGGWYTDNQFTNAYDFNTPVTDNVYLWAKWDREVVVKKYIVEFDVLGILAQEVNEGEKVQKPADPTQEGFTFEGWYTDKECTKAYDFDAPVTADLTLYAKWAEVIVPELHECESVCPICGGCTDKACTEDACKEKCTAGVITYSDVKETDWFYDEICTVDHNGIMNGVGDGKFAPYESTSRAMLITMLYRLEGEPVNVTGAKAPYSDVVAGSWYEAAVIWGTEKGIIMGWNGKYNPDEAITREDAMVILYRYAKMKGADVSAGESTNILSYTDADQISEYAVSAMQWGVAAKIMEGDGVKLNPKGGAIRAEIACLLARFTDVIKAAAEA